MTTTNGHRKLNRATLDDPETALQLERIYTAAHGNVQSAALYLTAARCAAVETPLETDMHHAEILTLRRISESLRQLDDAAMTLKREIAVALGKAAEEVQLRFAEAEKSRVPAGEF